MDIPAIIRSETAKILKESRRIGVFSAWHVNNGSCYELAKNVAEVLRDCGVEHEVLDNIWLIRRGPMEGRRSGIGRMGQHYFVFANGKYYDSECPDGVVNPYDLPIAIAAIESKASEALISEFLSDESADGEFPCPEPVKDALRSTLESYLAADPAARGQEGLLFSMALRDVCGPIEMYIGIDDLDRFGRTVGRVLRSLGIGAGHEHGVDPNTDEKTAWIRLADGSVAYLDLAPLDRASGRYRRDNMSIIHPDDSTYAAFVPASDFCLAI